MGNETFRCHSQRKSCIFRHAQSNMQIGGATVKRFRVVAQYRPVHTSNFAVTSFGEKTRRKRWIRPPPSRFGEFNMAWYAYCLTEHQTLPNGTRTRRPFLLEGVQGVNGAAVLSYPSGEFAVIVSEYDHTASELDQKAAIEHAQE
jgi:hypothetical protein